jgi:hypothetical protein
MNKDDPSRDHNLVCITYKRDKYDRIAKSGPDAGKFRKETEYLQVIADNGATATQTNVLELNRVMFLSGWGLDKIMPASGISQDY